MQLKLNTLKDFFKIWKEDFLGQKGLFLPADKRFTLGQTISVQLIVQDEDWGRIEVVPVWVNLFGMEKEEMPHGTFLRLIKTGPKFERKLAAVK